MRNSIRLQSGIAVMIFAALILSACDRGKKTAVPGPESPTDPVAEAAPVPEFAAELKSPADAPSPLAFEPAVFSYKAKPSETEMTATFKVRNEGSRPVRITKIDTTCDCLSASADVTRIEPSGVSTITAVYDIARLSGEATKQITVETDHPNAKMTRLSVQVSIPPIVDISPTVVEWNVGEEPKAKEIVFKVLRDEPIRIVASRSSRRQVTLEMKTIEEGREYRLILTPKSTEDILLGFVSIETDCELEQHKKKMAYFGIKEPVGNASND